MRMASIYRGFDVYIISCNTSVYTSIVLPLIGLKNLLVQSHIYCCSAIATQLKDHCYANINRTYYSRLQDIVSF